MRRPPSATGTPGPPGTPTRRCPPSGAGSVHRSCRFRAVRIATWNVNALTGERIERVLAWLDMARPHVLCLQETKVGDAAFPALDFHAHGYDSVHHGQGDRKSTRLNSSHVKISYAVFCLKKKKQQD